MIDVKESRMRVHNILNEVADNVYFQRPSNTQLKLPYIVYNLSSAVSTMADNELYKRSLMFNITVVTKDPDDELPSKVHKALKNAEWTNTIVVDRTYNHYFQMYI